MIFNCVSVDSPRSSKESRKIAPLLKIQNKRSERSSTSLQQNSFSTIPERFGQWSRRQGCEELALCASTLLAINCSEAPVERSFSSQKLTHSLIRNKLKLDSVQAQLYAKLNAKALAAEQTRSILTTDIIEEAMALADVNPMPAAVEAEAEAHDQNDQKEDVGDEQAEDQVLMIDQEGEDDDQAEQADDQDEQVEEPDIEPDENDEFEDDVASAMDIVTRRRVPMPQFEPVFTDRLRQFARHYIQDNALVVDRTWRKRGSADQLRNAIANCDNPLIRKEMPDVMQRCIE